ncbi:hypothetical protein CA13_39090 [Planctomycetes bacterium CA13]|uniref:Uncharacterized protein n=1 Tax=Novipirellula herctigrandis TaxID=2527986 RepID=A0A5C5Z5U7_9BACT|nr:hypothetical protein CA13_39090 [Planctomycetes bacterium CA13]
MWPSPLISIVYCGVAVVYLGLKIVLRQLAAKWLDNSFESLIPSAVIPWLFFGYCQASEQEIEVIDFNLFKPKSSCRRSMTMEDHAWHDVLNSLAEFRVMHALTLGYHAVSSTNIDSGYELECRDLRSS